MRQWTVAAAIIEGPDGVLLVQNRRRNGSLDWSTPGGVVEAGEEILEGLAREVLEETGVAVTRWSEVVYTVETAAPQMGWHLSVVVHQALDWSGELVIDDPDGIVEVAEFLSHARVAEVLEDNVPWVREPLLEWLGERWTDRRSFSYTMTGADRATAVIARTSNTDGPTQTGDTDDRR